MITSLLLALLVLVLIYWITTMLPLNSTGRQAVNIIIAVIAIVWLLKIFGVVF